MHRERDELAVGQVARPVTDRHHVARAKLAYLIDSTSAPVAVLAPFSSWGASIIGIMAPIVATSTLAVSDVEAFLGAAGMNYYAISAILLVWVVVLLQLDIGPMRVFSSVGSPTSRPVVAWATCPRGWACGRT